MLPPRTDIPLRINSCASHKLVTIVVNLFTHYWPFLIVTMGDSTGTGALMIMPNGEAIYGGTAGASIAGTVLYFNYFCWYSFAICTQ